MAQDLPSRIGTLTLHAGFNEGAILQSLALQRAISELRPEHDVEVVDHRYPSMMQVAYGDADNDRKRALQDFYDNKLPVSPQRFNSGDNRETFSYIQNRYSAVVVGSDEVWKIAFRYRFKRLLRFQTDPLAPAFPNIFWPGPDLPQVKLSYAATVGAKTDWKNFPKRFYPRLRKILESFTAIGVRDTRTKAFVEEISPQAAQRLEWTPDPTLITDLTKEVTKAQLQKKLQSFGVDYARPRLLFIGKKNPNYEPVIEEMRRKGYQIITLSDDNSYGDVDLTGADIGVLEWAAMASQVDLCISERMHGCIFTALNGCPLISVDTRRRALGFPTKNEELMHRLGLQERYFSIMEPGGAEALLAFCKQADVTDFDRTALQSKLDSFRAIGRSYLDRNLPVRKS